jgi:serine/threonine-protein kinase
VLAPVEQDLPKAGDSVAAKYRIDETLGRGGMGAVFRVTHSVTGKSFAVKWLLPQHHAGQEIAQRFIREAQVAGRVDHPNIVEVYDIGEDRGSMYMVMELLQGESLAQHLARVGRVAASQACQLMIPVTRGLAAAHRSGIIHRDLKPDNIFLSVSTLGEPRPKILDFGISKMSALATDANPALTREGVVMGTPNYMAPEQLRSNKVDERCDIYALGVILYQMLGGKLPFIGDNFPDLMLKIISESPVPLAKLAPDVPRDLVAIVECAMSRSPAERFESVAELGRALERFGQGALFDVEAALSTRPVSSVLPGPATPVATESRFPDTAAQPIDFAQRAQRMAFPLAISALSALLFSWIYVSLGDPTTPATASAAAVQIDPGSSAPRRPGVPSEPAPAMVGAQDKAPEPDPDALPVPDVTTLAELDLAPIAKELATADAPALIGALAPEAEVIEQVTPEAEPSPVAQVAVSKGSASAAEPELSIPSTAAQAAAAAAAAAAKAPAGIAPQSYLALSPVPPPGAAEQVTDPAAANKLKKAPAVKKAAPKQYEAPELRINDF